MRTWQKYWSGFVAVLLLLSALVTTGCGKPAQARETPEETAAAAGEKPSLPAEISIGADGVPVLSVYDVAEKKLREMDVETYVEGVLAGEMKSDWPQEALKAQAILARTFVLRFITSKHSEYEGADISTDIKEAQAYAADKIDASIKKAVAETRGEVLVSDGEFPYAWFHAHAGGMTELPGVALEYEKGDPSYTEAVESPESDKAPDSVKNWTAKYTKAEVAEACANVGVSVSEVETVEIGKTGASGRAQTILVNGKAVSAPSLRLELDGTKMKSTLIHEIGLQGDHVVISGSGYGHGVGLSQWGAYGLAEAGKNAAEIVNHYFRNVELVHMWD